MICKKCNVDKPLSEFHKEPKGKYGVRRDCKSCKNLKRKANWAENIAREKAKNRKWYRANKNKAAELHKWWKENNKNRWLELSRHHTAKYRAKKLSGTLEGHESELKEIYENCPEGHHVDHIIPLQGKNVSGLHVPWNLQYLTASQNLSKGNK